LNVYYKALGKKLIFTAHNVNAGERDEKDGLLNKLSLRFLYHIVDHVFVHTEKMKEQLIGDFGIKENKVTVIPFGINNVIPRTLISTSEAREKLCLSRKEKIILFFGNIAPYKGLDTLIMALANLKKRGNFFKLIIAGKVKDRKFAEYWERIEKMIEEYDMARNIIKKIEYIPDNEVELYFKSSDALILPYRHIFQSGVLFLSYSFGLPVIVADVGSLKEDIIEGKTGFAYRREDVEDLADKIIQYFESDLYTNLEAKREGIIEYVNEKYSWLRIGEITRAIYGGLQ
jgi:glycosyltransferase involved in cell wall biosynthesis